MDFEGFRSIFVAECNENLDVIEAGLLGLEQGEADAEMLNRIFRAAHTIKGNAASFGMHEMVSLAHRLESVLGDWRRQELAPGPEVTGPLLEAVDGLRRLAGAEPTAQEPDVPELCQALEGAPAAFEAVEGWRIRFLPGFEVLASGSRPLLMFRELARLGELTVRADVSRLPDWEGPVPERCYLGWDLELRGDIPRDLVEQTFEWVREESLLELAPLEAGTAPPPGRQPDPPEPPPSVTPSSFAWRLANSTGWSTWLVN